ncbi:MAG: glutamate--tRNA ligase [Candidatus Omnitrophica bacterium]|nr:glutamate--tRNA ligase [Candidatus Omnitrophota bacterium]
MLRVRFAPSPTGFLHIGGARTALFNWIYARKNKGQFILRIEDTDQNRSQPEYLNEILDSLKWLNMDWDQIYYQSKRFDIYLDFAQKLIDKGCAYKKDQAIFFKYNFNQIEVNDLIRGKVVFNELPKEEEVIIKKDGTPAYNFSCSIDDALMEINCVIRGEDHLSNTPKQILIYQALDFKIPDFAHLPLILSPEGGRLSKRFGATAISEYRKEGYLPESLSNYLLLLGWSPGEDREILSLSEAEKIFKLKDVNKTGAAFSLDKLNWINGYYIRNRDIDKLTKEIHDYLVAQKHPYQEIEYNQLKRVVELFKTRLTKLSEFAEKAEFCFSQDVVYSDQAKEVLENKIPDQIINLKEKFSQINQFEKEIIEAEFRKAAKAMDLKLGVLVHPVRIALTGSKKGPGLFETMEFLGKERVLYRLDKLIQYWQKKEVK